MTIVFRNASVTIGIILVTIVIIAVGLLLIYFLPDLLPGFHEMELTARQLIFNITIPFSFALYAFTASLVFRITFSKTLAPEMFFFTIFILTLSIELFRIVQLYFIFTSAPFFYGMVTTRAVYFGRFLRIYTIFVAGLFACSINNPKTGIYLGIGILLAMAFAIGIPIDATRQSQDFLYINGIERYVRITFWVVEFLSVINFILAGVLKSTKEYFFMAAAFVLIICGSELLVLFPLSLPILPIGLVLLITGTAVFGKRTHELYLWI